MSFHIVGPPALHDAPPSVTGNVTVDEKPPTGRTANNAPTFLSTGNPCLDFFFHIVPDIPVSELIHKLELAWAHDALLTLKLIFNLRAVRGTGKSDRAGFYAAALWLHEHHPKTLALNLGSIHHFGCFKDLPEILYRLHEGLDVRRKAKEEWQTQKKEGTRKRIAKKIKRKERKRSGVSETEEESNVEKMSNNNILDKTEIRNLRKARDLNKARRALEKHRNDPNYRFLYDCICNLFAEALKVDLDHMRNFRRPQMSLAAKWCPSLDSSYDKTTLICEGIARRIFRRDCFPEYDGLTDAQYAYRARSRLKKEYLVPLRKRLHLPEVYMSTRKWRKLAYHRVASVAMQNYKTIFMKRDKERFNEYVELIRTRSQGSLATGAIHAHEILMGLNDEDRDDKINLIAELQWLRMIWEFTKTGNKLKNCIAVSDVSGSMGRMHMEASISLGLLVSELTEDPWKSKLITFSANPEFHFIRGETMWQKTDFLRWMEIGSRTDLQKVFDRILDVAVDEKIPEDQMVNRIFVFSAMEFDEKFFVSRQRHRTFSCSSSKVPENKKINKKTEKKKENEEKMSEENENKIIITPRNEGETDYQLIQRKFTEKGYKKIPEIVFWNLANSSSVPVVSMEGGVAMVSGFSKNLLNIFLDQNCSIVNPEQVMQVAISGDEYKKLVLYD